MKNQAEQAIYQFAVLFGKPNKQPGAEIAISVYYNIIHYGGDNYRLFKFDT